MILFTGCISKARKEGKLYKVTESKRLVVTVQELAPLLNTSTGVIYRMVRQNKIPHRKIGRQTVFSIPGIKKWLEGDSGDIENTRRETAQ